VARCQYLSLWYPIPFLKRKKRAEMIKMSDFFDLTDIDMQNKLISNNKQGQIWKKLGDNIIPWLLWMDNFLPNKHLIIDNLKVGTQKHYKR
jgi:hypothetical protein